MSTETYADIEKNRLYITFGEMDRNKFKEFAVKILGEARKLKKGFTCVNDLRNFRISDPNTVILKDVEHVSNVMKELKRLGISYSARIVSPQALLFSLLTEYEKEICYDALCFEDIEDAESALDDIESETPIEND